MIAATTEPVPFEVRLASRTLDELRARRQATRWGSDPGNEDEEYGVSTSSLKALVEHWVDGFDWRAAQAEINSLSHFRVELDGVRVHFLRQPDKGPRPIPIIRSRAGVTTASLPRTRM